MQNVQIETSEDQNKNQKGTWIDKTTCLFNIFDEKVKISVVVKVFANKQLLVTMSDSKRLNWTISTKKMASDADQQLIGDDYMREAMLLGDDNFGEKPSLKDIPPEVVQSHLLLGQREKQTFLEMTANNLFKEVSSLGHFVGVQGMVLQIGLNWLANNSLSRKEEQDKTREMINQIKTKLS